MGSGLLFRVQWIPGRGGWGRLVTVVCVLFCCSSVLYQCQEMGVKSLFYPQINCHIPKLSPAPGVGVSVSFPKKRQGWWGGTVLRRCPSRHR